MNGFERRKEQKKESIRRAALELFKQYGFKKVSINDVASKAGVSPVTIYNHFNSKDGLIKEAIKTQVLNMMEKYRSIIDGEGAFPEKLEKIIFDKTEIASQFDGELLIKVYQEDPEIQELLNNITRQNAVQMTLQLFDKGKEEGYVDKGLSEEVLIFYLEILRKGIVAQIDTISSITSYPEMVRDLNNIFLYGLVGRKARE